MRDWACRPLRWLALRRATAGALAVAITLALVCAFGLGTSHLVPSAKAAAPTFSVLKTLDLGSKAPYEVAVNPNTNHAFVVSSQSNTLWVIDDDGSGSSLLATLIVSGASYLNGVAVNPTTGDVFITSCAGNGNVYETHDDGAATVAPTVIANHGLEHLFGVAVNPNTGHVFVADYSTNQVFVYKDSGTSSSLIGTFATTADRPDQIAVNTTNNHVYVEHNSDAAGDLNIFQDGAGDNDVSLLTSVSVGVIGYGVGVNPTTGHIFFTGTRNAPPTSYSEIAVIQDKGAGTSAADIIQRSDGIDVQGVAVDPIQGYVYVATPNFRGSNGVQLYQDSAGSGTNVLTSVEPINTGASPHYIAFNPTTGDLIVPDYGNGYGTSLAIVHEQSAADTTTTTSDLSIGYGTKSVSLSASVSPKDSTTTVNQGTITFTVSSGATTLCTSDAIAVVDGKVTDAACEFASPTPSAGDGYTITATYSDTSGAFTGSSDTKKLTVTPAPLTITADDKSMIYGDPVPAFTVSYDKFVNGDTAGSLSGTLICQAKDKSGNTVSSTTPVGQYSIDCSSSTLSDANYTISYTPGTLTITPRDTTTDTGDINLTYGTTSVLLTATVSAKDDASLIVNEGIVTFTVSQGTTTVCTSAAIAVSQGQASGGTCAIGLLDQGSYTITASYTDAVGNFADSSGTATLTIGAAATKTTLASNPTIVVGTTSLSLSASVTASGLTVGQGSVTFVVTDSQGNQIASQAGNVTGGAANVTLTLPADAPLGVYTITANYHDPTGDFTNSSDTGTLTITDGIIVVGGSPVTAHHGFWAVVELQVVDANGVDQSSRNLSVTSQNLAPVGQPWDGTHPNLVYNFQYGPAFGGHGHGRPSSGYRLMINTRPLSPGDYTLSFTVAGDPVVHTVTIRVVP